MLHQLHNFGRNYTPADGASFEGAKMRVLKSRYSVQTPGEGVP